MKGSLTSARAYALKLLSYRSRSRKELLQRLHEKSYDPVQISDTIAYLEETGLVNDEALAVDLLRYTIEQKSLGERGIRLFLQKRGIDKSLIEKTLQTYERETENRSAREFVERKIKSLRRHPEHVIRRRLWGMLQRRGFSVDVIRKEVDSVL